MPSIQVFATQQNLISQAHALAEQLNVPFTEDSCADCDYLLIITPDYIGIQQPGKKTAAFFIDFLSAASRYRQKNLSLRSENLARALGLKNHKPNKIIDATAGLGRDSFIIASLGFQVEMIERSPIINVLLADALTRAASDPEIAPVINRMQLLPGNALTLLPTLPPADVIYLDPMFPKRTKSALVKKEMRLFHELVGDDLDADQLLKIALTCAAKRVVVKRPKLAAYLAELTPDYSVKGNSSRFDIYLT
ncbi:MAG: class I SAM-dependent methyltransferase [Pseudomonadota bacterium]